MIQSKLRNRLGLAKEGKLVFCYRMLRGKDEVDWWTLKLYDWTEKCRYKIVVTVLTCLLIKVLYKYYVYMKITISKVAWSPS